MTGLTAYASDGWRSSQSVDVKRFGLSHSVAIDHETNLGRKIKEAERFRR